MLPRLMAKERTTCCPLRSPRFVVSMNPPVALLVGWWLGHETFSFNVLLGLPIVLGSVALHAWMETRQRAAPEPARTFTEPCRTAE